MDFCRLSLLYYHKLLDVFEKNIANKLYIGITTSISSIFVLLIRLFQLINGAQVLNVTLLFLLNCYTEQDKQLFLDALRNRYS